MPRTGGHPTKLTHEVAQAIAEAVRTGVPIRFACARLRIGYSTVAQWIQRGEGTHVRKCDRRFVEFVELIRKAEAENAEECVRLVKESAKGGQLISRQVITKSNGEEIVSERYAQGQWTAAMTLLERRHPEEFARREVHEHTGKDGKELEPVRFVVIERAAREPKVVEAVPEPPALPPLTIAEEGVA